jgi:hypothetical protein
MINFCLLIGNEHSLKQKNAVFTTQKTVSAAQLIVPGKSIGQTSLQEDAKLVLQKLGKPDDGDSAMGKSLFTWYANHYPFGYETQVFCSHPMGGNESVSRVKQIRVTSPYFKTANGIGAGATLKQINASFKLTKTATFKEDKHWFAVYNSDKGIAFETNAAGKCVGVIVYPAGNLGDFNYLPFHNNLKIVAK